MKKSISIISVCAALSVLASVPFSADAAGSSHTGDYMATIQLSRYAMTAEEAASGSGSAEVSAYIRGAVKDGLIMRNVQAEVTGYQQFYMRNLVDISRTSEEKTYSCLGNSFTTAYTPFCFGKLSGGVYSSNTFMFTGRDACMDPISGGEISYMGNDTISFKLPGRYYVDENGNLAQDNVSHVITCPLTVQPDGSATYTFKYADIYYDHVDVATETGVIPYYQPELLEVGGKIPDVNNKFSWMADSNASTSFLGNSNDFPLMQTEAILKKDTPCGIYNLSFNEAFCDFSAEIDGASVHLPLRFQGAAIAVGVETADMSAGGIMPIYACYFAEDTKTITGASVGVDYICDVSYTDGTSEAEKNVTGAVNAGTSPMEIMSGISEKYFIGDIPMYCGDTQLTFNGSKNTIKALIGKKGDVNLDGSVGIDDASAVLEYYAKRAAGIEPQLTDDAGSFDETLAFFLGDIDTESQNMNDGGALDISDATCILSYYANNAAGSVISWDTFLK